MGMTVSQKNGGLIEILIKGEIDSEQMRNGLDAFIKASEGIASGKILYVIADFKMPSMPALAVEFSYLPQLFGLIGRFDKAAVCCDEAWIRRAAVLEGTVIPGLEIRAYDGDEVDAAMAWLMKSMSINNEAA